MSRVLGETTLIANANENRYVGGMADPHILSTLHDKVYELRRLIADYEAALEKARADLEMVQGTFALFQREGGLPQEMVAGVGVRSMFKRGETWEVCQEALASAPDGLTTRDLAFRCLEARGYDPNNGVLRRAMISDLSNMLKKRWRKREVGRGADRDRSAVWRHV